VAKVEEHLADAVSKGARVLAGGARLRGNFFQPTVVSAVDPAMRLFNEETFGPVVPLATFNTEAEVVALANATPFGLAAYFYTRDASRIWRVGASLEAGLVGINDFALSSEVAPFGGVKASGYGREGSKYGLDEYLQTKFLLQGNLAAAESP
jgi:succinate-semialdehyde dehydrogenase/glutarate-semialdehyde dehydrogenase